MYLSPCRSQSNDALSTLQNNGSSNHRVLLIHAFFEFDAENLLGLEILVLMTGTFLRYHAHQRYKANLILWIKFSNPLNSNPITPLRSDHSKSLGEMLKDPLRANFHRPHHPHGPCALLLASEWKTALCLSELKGLRFLCIFLETAMQGDSMSNKFGEMAGTMWGRLRH